MFTGLVQAMGEVGSMERTASGARLRILLRDWAHRPGAGESVCVSGVCLTALGGMPAAPSGHVDFDVIPETLARTNLARLRPGALVNLEQSLTPADLMGGHIVQGHIDGLARIRRIARTQERRLTLSAPADLMPYLVPKGSVTLDGVSLTIAAADPRAATFEVALIPTTLEVTTLGRAAEGEDLNLETDIIARTVVNYLRHHGT